MTNLHRQTKRVLITGANGQLGTELTLALRSHPDVEFLLATDISSPGPVLQQGNFETLDVLNTDHISAYVRKHKINEIYHLAALLSAKAETMPLKAWSLNMDGLLNVLETALQEQVRRVFWPSSIAVFGPDVREVVTAQTSPANPTTVYGISKVAGEQWAAYYHRQYGLDVRSLRYPGLISYQTAPGGGTTDYAVEIFHSAVAGETYRCFLKEDTTLPMMYMADAVRAAVELMDTHADKITVRTSYNLTAMSFTPAQLSEAIVARVRDFKVIYEPDRRQMIAETWPSYIDDALARRDWGWMPEYSLGQMTDDMLLHLQPHSVRS